MRTLPGRAAARIVGLTSLSTLALVVLLAYLYEVLEPVHRGLALFAALCSLVYALAWILMALDLFAVIRLLTRPDYLRDFGAQPLQAFVSASLGAGFEKYYAGLLFHAVKGLKPFGIADTRGAEA